jgi:hypothetical protein
MRMLTTRIIGAGATTLLLVGSARGQLRPPELVARAEAAGLSGPILRWCPAEFQSGRPGAFAVAIGSTRENGRYLALDVEGPPIELARFEGTVDLSCYSRAEAERIDADIRASDTIHGSVRPRWDTTVVCGFIEAALAVCWQHDPATHRFVEVGRWTT